jgi:hypothetical protein
MAGMFAGKPISIIFIRVTKPLFAAILQYGKIFLLKSKLKL